MLLAEGADSTYRKKPMSAKLTTTCRGLQDLTSCRPACACLVFLAVYKEKVGMAI